MIKLTKKNISIGVIVILHLVGIIGLSSEYQSYFLALTPLNLVVSGYFVLRHSETKKPLLFVAMVVLTYLIESLGVHTGFPFGYYRYGSSLGPQLYQVPMLIGLLWLLLLHGASFFAGKWVHNQWINALLVAGLMTTIDFAIEPVAIQLDFWTWFGNSIPWNNYASWFVTALILSFISKADNTFGNNKVAGVFFIIQVVFFLSLNFIL